jgi:short-subunit dehydrogenase
MEEFLATMWQEEAMKKVLVITLLGNEVTTSFFEATWTEKKQKTEFMVSFMKVSMD